MWGVGEIVGYRRSYVLVDPCILGFAQDQWIFLFS